MELVYAVLAVFLLYGSFLSFRNAIDALEIGDSFWRSAVSNLLFAVSGSATGGLAFVLFVEVATHVTQ